MSKRIQSYTVRGRTLGVSAWARELGVSAPSFYTHAARFGVSMGDAIAHYIDHPKGSMKARRKRAAVLLEMLTDEQIDLLAVAVKRLGAGESIHRLVSAAAKAKTAN